MKVLIACEESQTVAKAFRARGHEAFSADIQLCGGGCPQWHIHGDVIPYINGDCTLQTENGDVHTIAGQWDLLIAHPPCTYMSGAGACRMYPEAGKPPDAERLKKALSAREFFFAFVNAACEHIAIENPRPLSIVGLPEESQQIQPFQFGEPYSKLTYLWLKNLPPLKYTKVIEVYKPYVSCGTSRNKGKTDKSGVSRAGGAAKIRSKTFPGIAEAMADQWGDQISSYSGGWSRISEIFGQVTLF